MADKPKYETREQWLAAAVVLMTPLFEEKGYKVPKVRVSCGWPSTRGTSRKKRAVGECWSPEAASDKIAQIFVSPYLNKPSDKDDVTDTLVHEVVHAVVGNKEGHNKVFGKCARAVGLVGKLTQCYAGPELLEKVQDWCAKLGPYPHGGLNGLKSPHKKQSTRLVKCECDACGYNVRITRKWLEQGAPLCPIVEAGKPHGPMSFDVPAGLEFEGDDEGGGE